MRAKVIDPNDEWAGRVGEVHPMTPGTCHHDGDCLWVQFEDGEGGEHRREALLIEDEL